MIWRKKSEITYIHTRDPRASDILAGCLDRCIRRAGRPWEDLVCLCIGSSRIAGDSLGPLVGGFLLSQQGEHFHVYGTPEDPVHAMNLRDALAEMALCHPGALVLAVDASLGQEDHQHHITVGQGSIRPGAGTGKQLPPVGDIFITGIVSSFDKCSHRELQSVDFPRILRMADIISRGILQWGSQDPGQGRFLTGFPRKKAAVRKQQLFSCQQIFNTSL